jgi:hypothetical protein
MFYWARQRSEFVVAKCGITCGMIFHVVVDGGEVVITVARQDRAEGKKAVKEETRTVPLIDFIDAIHRLWENAK